MGSSGGSGGGGGGDAASTTFDPSGLTFVTGTDVQQAVEDLDTALGAADLVTFNRQTADYTLVLTDRGKVVEMDEASAIVLTVPTNTSVAFPVGTSIGVTQYGVGATTIAAAGGVTLNSRGADLVLAGQFAVVTLLKVATDEWYVTGDL